ncbi:MAG: AAA family ATPase, partial [Thiomargarita sp.]|nr:AAA family ATPase [Thiomargarita sp.]
MLKFPYGICDFYSLITENYFYVDRTDKIALLENCGKYLLFLRPRRFGKSLLLSMLENYYDIAKASEFERLFGHLAIGKNSTPKHNQYFILNWDFSDIDPTGEPHEIRQRMHNYINGSFEQFISYYKDFLDYDIQLDATDALRSLQSIFAAVKRTPYKIYLLIDEYDNFANEVMMLSTNRQRYDDLLQGEGAFKTIFKAIKTGTKGIGIDRIFITGVSPVVMSDITSGFNIAENIYLKAQFNDLCGFWESEIKAALQNIATSCTLSTEQVTAALELMRIFYNGYNFSNTAKALIYNPTLALYFFKNFQETCQYPRRILDTNLMMDKGKITYISLMPGGKQIIIDAVDSNHQLKISELSDRFGLSDILKTHKDNQFQISLLYYFGVLTFDGYTDSGKMILKIP